ncbi:hypothetical protein FS749_000469 [Ceratobasidium sp. UAMH 11750]|nr:hypothetical protein FS749_000469 [Ceratobasidium sp. UAMH 11750]
MRLSVTATILAAVASDAAAMWNQCGGIGWQGSTKCEDGSICMLINPYYSQCVPDPGAPTTTPTPTTPTPTTVTPTTPINTCGPSVVAGALLPRASGPPIHALDGWAKDTWLQKSKTSSNAILGPASSKGWYLPSSTIRLIYGICPQFLYLNVLNASTSYKPMSFDIAAKTSNWNYGGDGTLTINGTNTFITCSDGALYFQTGKDLPAGNCTTTRLTTHTDI